MSHQYYFFVPTSIKAAGLEINKKMKITSITD